MSGIFDWYRKPVSEREEIVYQAELEKTVTSIVNYYKGLGKLARAIEKRRGGEL